MSVNDRLGRLLFIVPYVVHRDGVPVRELAQVLGVPPSQIEADINLLCMVGRPPLTPDHLIDVMIEDGVVYVELDQNFSRPLQLTHEEARALALGASLVGDLGGLGKELDQVLNRLVEHLNPADKQAVLALRKHVMVQGEAPEVAAHAALLRQAIAAHRGAEVLYYSASSDRAKRYTLKPLALFTHGGDDYVVALDGGAADQEKLFRLDRIGAVTLLDTHFLPTQTFDLEKFRTSKLYFGADSLQAHVRFSPKVAPTVRERFARADIVREDGRGLEVRVRTASAAWLARWVLSFGEDAEVLSPPSTRQYLSTLCQQAAAAYASQGA